MSRCQHCKKLTHSEDLNVYYHPKDQEKVYELTSMRDWTSKFAYAQYDDRLNDPNEYGKLKVGDIYIHFIAIKESQDWGNPITP